MPDASDQPATGRPTPVTDALAVFAPKLADITRSLVFGDLWKRREITPRDRSMITVAALLALGRDRELGKHMERARANGVTREEMAEIVTHLTMYCGLPAGSAAAVLAYDAYEVDGGGLRRRIAEFDAQADGSPSRP